MAVSTTVKLSSVGLYSKLAEIGITVGIILSIILLQCVWLFQSIGQKIALVNLFPAALLITVWVLFISHYYASRLTLRILLILPVLILSLRLPVTISHELHLINWLMLVLMLGTIVRQVLTSFSGSADKIYLLLTFVILSANTFHHLGTDSPFTYTFRISNQVASNFTGEHNNASWECQYDQKKYPVHCDARHFSMSERIFTEPNYDASQSVVLQRFLHGYLNSLVGLEGTRYWGNLALNMSFWFLACACIYRICCLLKLEKDIAAVSMLCCASAWGFVSMVAQPAPYLLAYAYAIIVIWASLELIFNELGRRRSIFFIVLIASIILVYDAYQMILVSAVLLFLHKKRSAAVSVFLLQFLFTAVWNYFSLKMVLGTQGELTSDSHSIANISLDITTWLEIVKTFNFSQAFHFSSVGMQAYLYGNLFFAAIAAWAYIFGLNRPKIIAPEQRTLLLMLIVINTVVIVCAIFIVPQMFRWSPITGMQPRILFYSFPINIIALNLILFPYLKKTLWIVPVVLLVVANLNLTGLASIDMVFDYGRFGVFWK